MRWLALLTVVLFGAPAFVHEAQASGDAPAAHEAAAAHGAPAAHGEAAHGDAGHAADEGHGEAHEDHTAPPLKAIGLHAINFVALYALLFLIARKPISQLLKERQTTIRQELEDADGARVEAQKRFDALEARLAHFDDQVEELRATAQAQAEREAEFMAERTQRDLVQIKETASRAIREETRNARLALKRDAVDLAVKLAEERIRDEISASDQQRLAGEFLVSVQEDKGHV